MYDTVMLGTRVIMNAKVHQIKWSSGSGRSLLMNLMRSTKRGSFNLSRGLLESQLKASALFKAMIIIFENLQSIQFQKLSLCSQKHIPASIE